MKKFSYLILGGIALSLLFFFANPNYAEKRTALGSVGHTRISAKHHQAVIVEGGGFAFRGQHNLKVIARATEYMGTLGPRTSLYREIARIAADADREYARYDAILDLAVRSTTNSQRVLALAESVQRIDSPENEAVWQAAYDAMLEMAEYPTVEVAVASQRMD